MWPHQRWSRGAQGAERKVLAGGHHWDFIPLAATLPPVPPAWSLTGALPAHRAGRRLPRSLTAACRRSAWQPRDAAGCAPCSAVPRLSVGSSGSAGLVRSERQVFLA